MSLKQFLAVGKSFEDVPEGKSPFEMRPEVKLPRFEHEPRFTTRPPVPVQTDWLAEHPHRPAEPKGAPVAKKKAKRTRGSRSWLQILTFGILGRKRAAVGELVQEEMVLEKVRVMRNDLVDSDLEVVVNKKKKFALRAVKAEAQAKKVEAPEPTPVEREVIAPERVAPAPARAVRPKKHEWSELTARLFELGQH
jgi:hypothetical protein